MADGSVKIDITADDSDIKKKLNDVGEEAEEAADKLDDLGDSAKKSGKGFGVADVAIGSFISNGVTALIGKVGEAISSLIALADETREYREDMAKLEAGFKSAGHTTDTAKKAYNGFYKILGESDRSVEAVNHLAELTTNTEDVAKWTTIAAGVTAKFGDSLPIEGLTEAANETAKVGAVTGPLADALNWAGISEDAFNEKLKACNSEQERATLITNTLSQEYQAAATEYNTLTAGAQAARDATNRMEQAQAALGAAIEPVTTAWTNIKAAALEWVAESVTAKQSTDVLTESQRANMAAVEETAAAYSAMKAASEELSAVQMANVDYAQNSLLPQLQSLVDENGRVLESDKARVDFIIGELNEALGTEYTSLQQIIGANGQVKDSIYAAIEAKKAQILLAAYEDDYKTAIEGVKKAEEERAQALLDVIAQEEAVAQKRKEFAAIDAQVTQEAIDNGGEVSRAAMMRHGIVAGELAKEEQALRDLEASYNTAEDTVKKHHNDIDAYTIGSTLLMQGETDKAISYLQTLSSEYMTAEDAMAAAKAKGMKTTEEQTAHAEAEMLKRVQATQINLALEKQNFEKHGSSMSAEQQKQTKARIAELEKYADEAVKEFEKIGGNIPEGMAKGADGKGWTLSGAMKRVVDNAIAAAKKAADSHSPSKRAEKEVGVTLPQGIAVGVKKEEGVAVDAASDMMKNVMETLVDGQDETIKKATDFAEEIAQCLEDAANEEKDSVIAHANEMKRIRKKHNDDLWEENHQHELAMQKLKEDYNEKIADLNKQKNKDSSAYVKAEKELHEKEQAEIAKHNEAVKKLDEERTANLQKEFEAKQNIINSQMQALLDHDAEYAEKAKAIWTTLDENITKLQEDYQTNLENRAKSIADSMNLFESISLNNVRGSDLKKALQSQVNVLEAYNEDIASLASRGVFSSEMLDSIKEMGVDIAAEVSALNRMTDKELSEYAELWEQKQALAMEAATAEMATEKESVLAEIETLTTEATSEYMKLREEYKTQGALLAAELKQSMLDAGDDGYTELINQVDDYTAAGASLMDGVIAGIEFKTPELISTFKDALRSAVSAGEDDMEIASPSKVTKRDIGYNLADGVVTGWNERITAARDIMAEKMGGIITRVRATVDAENARMAQGVGVRDLGITEVARAVGMQTAGINSLASEYRRGSSAQVTVPLVINGRELGRAIVDLGNAETIRTGTSLSFA